MKSPLDYSQPIMALEELERRLTTSEEMVKLENGQSIPVHGWVLDERKGSHLVAKAFIRAGAKFPTHLHSQIEIMVVVEGRAKYKLANDASEEMFRGDCVRVEDGIPHSFEAIEDTWVIVLLMPGQEDGDGRKR